jgi:hypothetical protein
MLLAVLAAEEAVGEALAPEEATDDSAQRCADALLHVLNRSAALQSSASSADGPGDEEVPYRLGLAILEPLSQLITPLLGRLQSRAADAQACCWPSSESAITTLLSVLLSK